MPPAKTESCAHGVEVPMPMLPAAEMANVEVPAATLVPLKYATCPCVPLREMLGVVVEIEETLRVDCEESTRRSSE